MKRYPIIREISNLLLAPILLFALYVQFHGDFGPGGGFQAGVIFGSGIILYALLYGLRRTQRFVTPGTVRFLASFGVLLYAGVGVATIVLGGNFLDYNRLVEVEHHADAAHAAGHAHAAEHHAPHAAEHHAPHAAEHHAPHAGDDDSGHHGHPGQHLGILLVELGVGITVAAVMIIIFYAFAGRKYAT